MMTIINWVLIGAIGLIVIVTALTSLSAKKKSKDEKFDNLGEKTRRSKTPAVDDVVIAKEDKTKKEKPADAKQTEQTNQTETKDHGTILIADKTAIVSKRGPVKPGKYSVFSWNKKEEKINIRIGIKTKQILEGEQISLVEEDEITPLGISIVLK